MTKLYPLPFFGMPSVTNRFHSMDIELINYCANNCVFCCAADRPKTKKIMSMENLKIILERVPRFNGDVALSDTGDPILLDDLPQKIALIKQCWPDCTISMTTTLSTLRSKEYFRDLFRAKLDQIMLSCYAFDERDYLEFHGSRKYANVLTNLEILGSVCGGGVCGGGERIILKDMINFNKVYPVPDYKHKKEKFLRYYHKLGFSQIYPTTIVPIHEEKENCWNLPIPCFTLWGFMAGLCEIHADLDIAPCCVFPNDKLSFGNLKEKNLTEIYDSETARDFRNKWWNMEQDQIPVCKRCKNYSTRVNNMQEFDRIVFWQAERLRGREVLFWGHETPFRRYGVFFGACKPVGMIFEHNEQGLSEFADIPVYTPEILKKKEFFELPLVLFAYRDEAAPILCQLAEEYRFPVKRLFVCPPSYNLGNGFLYDVV